MRSANPGALRLTQGTAWALKAMTGLVLAGDRAVSVGELARREGIPPTFLAKIVRVLVRARLLTARPGRGGGVKLARDSAEIPVLAVIEACEGPLARSTCLYYAGRPCLGPDCEVFCTVRAVEEGARRDLARASLRELVDSLAVHPDRAPLTGPLP